VTSVTDTARRFLEDAPPEIRDVLECYGDGNAKEPLAQDISDFAGKFLGAPMRMGPLSPTLFTFLPRRQVPPPIELADRLRRFFG